MYIRTLLSITIFFKNILILLNDLYANTEYWFRSNGRQETISSEAIRLIILNVVIYKLFDE